MNKLLKPLYRMNQIAGINKKAYTVGKVITITGLALTTIGFSLTVLTVGKFQPDEYELAQEFVDAVLA